MRLVSDGDLGKLKPMKEVLYSHKMNKFHSLFSPRMKPKRKRSGARSGAEKKQNIDGIEKRGKKIVQGKKIHAINEDETLPVHGKRSSAATNSSCSLTACSLVLPPRC